MSARVEDLAPIDDRAADAVVLRAVLMYVADKQPAFDEFFRVLRPGGHLSLYEPVTRVAAEFNADTLFGYEPGDCEDLAGRITEVYRQAQPADSLMMDFDEVDVFHAAERAGFDPWTWSCTSRAGASRCSAPWHGPTGCRSPQPAGAHLRRRDHARA